MGRNGGYAHGQARLGSRLSRHRGRIDRISTNRKPGFQTGIAWQDSGRRENFRVSKAEFFPNRFLPGLNPGIKIKTCEGGALPVFMSITGPREPHDYRELNL